MHDFLWGFATVPGSVAFRGALFAAFRRVVAEHGAGASWLNLLQLTNEQLCAWSAERLGQPLPSMEISSTCRGAAFGPADLVVDHADVEWDGLLGGRVAEENEDEDGELDVGWDREDAEPSELVV